MLIVRNLQKRYGIQEAVSNLSFSINRDEIVGFLGVNGAGKSTTMKMITGVIEPDAGDIEICGIDRRSFAIEAKRRIGYLAEQNPLYSEMYVNEYLRFIVDIFRLKDPQKAVREIIDRVGLSEEAHKKIKELSKGYRQRVGLAQALVHQPDVLILDEPTTGLDPNQILEIRSLIKQEAKGKIVLLSSHILQEIEAICTRVIILDKGMIIADQSIEELRRATENRFVLDVEFGKPMNVEIISSIEGVEHFESFSEGLIYRLSVSKDIRETIFECSVQVGNSINSLSFKPSSLEDLFTQLTHRKL